MIVGVVVCMIFDGDVYKCVNQYNFLLLCFIKIMNESCASFHTVARAW